LKTFAERIKALKTLDRADSDYEHVVDLRPFAVKLSKYGKYVPLLENSVAYMETPDRKDIPHEGPGSSGGGHEDGCGDEQGIMRDWYLNSSIVNPIFNSNLNILFWFRVRLSYIHQ
jgi:hypothetical protein